MTKLSCCLCCEGPAHGLKVLYDFGDVPLANALQCPGSSEGKRYPLRLMKCMECGHGQLETLVEPSILFSQYFYCSGTSATLRKHFRGLAAYIATTSHRDPRELRSLDIGANDGTLVREMSAQGFNARGVDPAKNFACETIDCYMWPEEAGRLGDFKFDVITACNVLAHTPDPRSFLCAALHRLNDDGRLIIEVADSRRMMDHGVWDTVYHEHVSYFGVSSLTRLVEAAGGAVRELSFIPNEGGSIRAVIQRPEDLWRGYPSKVLNSAAAIKIDLLGGGGRPLVAYGASAKSTGVVEMLGVRPEYFVEDNPAKVGLCTPHGIPIVGIDDLAKDPRDLAILVTRTFEMEITERVKARRPDRNDQFITYGNAA